MHSFQVLDTRLATRARIMSDDYTIADIATIESVRNLITFYQARELVDFDSLAHVPSWLDWAMARPAVERGLNLPGRG